MPMTAATRKSVGDHLIGKTDIGGIGDIWMGLFTTDPTVAGTQSGEVTGTGYARINVTALFGAFDVSTGEAVNTDEVNFGTPGSDWGTVAYVGYLTAVSAGTMKYFEQMPNPRNVTSGSRPVKFSAGQLKIKHT